MYPMSYPVIETRCQCSSTAFSDAAKRMSGIHVFEIIVGVKERKASYASETIDGGAPRSAEGISPP